MIPLQTEFPGRADQRGFHFTVLHRYHDIVLLQKKKPEHQDPCYEVVRLRIIPETRFPDGRVVQTHEALPQNEKWGTDGWSYPTLVDALKKFEHLKSDCSKISGVL